MGESVLITGGAGFIGSHVADALLERGHRVRALDNLTPQVHGPERTRPTYLADDVELVVGDIRDARVMQHALRGITAVFHLAAMVGVGQSMYQVTEYTSVNQIGTAVLLEALIKAQVKRLVVASSMSIYGEGLFRTRDGMMVAGTGRSLDQLRGGEWEVISETGEPLAPVPTPETKPPVLESVYALSKYDQERLCLLVGRAYGIPTVALRFFNVYGPRQALSNPYTGVLAIFASRLINQRRPLLFEDGMQKRDFVSVRDVARACCMALESDAPIGQVLNVGSGTARAIRDVAADMACAVGRPHIHPEITGKYRMGDIRHCFADISRAKKLLGYEPLVTFPQGLAELSEWLENQVARDSFAHARTELEIRGLTL
jgi:dTDP-L-rhamnose 4-epimerase